MAETYDNLKHSLYDWTDIDVAQYRLGVVLGIFESHVSFLEVKGVFWTDNPIGNALFRILEILTETDILEKRDEPDYQYRWKSTS